MGRDTQYSQGERGFVELRYRVIALLQAEASSRSQCTSSHTFAPLTSRRQLVASQ